MNFYLCSAVTGSYPISLSKLLEREKTHFTVFLFRKTKTFAINVQYSCRYNPQKRHSIIFNNDEALFELFKNIFVIFLKAQKTWRKNKTYLNSLSSITDTPILRAEQKKFFKKNLTKAGWIWRNISFFVYFCCSIVHESPRTRCASPTKVFGDVRCPKRIENLSACECCARANDGTLRETATAISHRRSRILEHTRIPICTPYSSHIKSFRRTNTIYLYITAREKRTYRQSTIIQRRRIHIGWSGILFKYTTYGELYIYEKFSYDQVRFHPE